MDSITIAEIGIAIIIALVSWNLKETYGLNGRAIANEQQLNDHERRITRLEGNNS